MLIELNIENILSYNDETSFSMETGKRLRKFNKTHTTEVANTKILKNAIIFGSNGSGKTNLLLSLELLQNLLRSPVKKVTDTLPYRPCVTSATKKDFSKIEITFFKNRKYTYIVKYNKNEIFYESLSYFENKTKHTYFERTSENIFNIIPEKYSNLQDSLRSNIFFIFELQNLNDVYSKDLYKWLFNDLFLLGSSFDSSTESNEDFEVIGENPIIKEALINFLSFADTNIVDLDIVSDITELSPNFKEALKLILSDVEESGVFDLETDSLTRTRLFTVYNKYNNLGEKKGTANISFNAESRGNRKLILIGLTILNNLDSEKVIIMDEFDSGLHLELSKALLKIFNTENNNNQYILTTHELQLLDSDLRKDQIWLAEKDYRGFSDLYSLFDFKDLKTNTRNDISFFRRYIKGQFGAVPNIDFEGMMSSIIQCKEDN